MQTLASWQDARNMAAVFQMEQGGALPADVRTTLVAVFAMPSPVDQFCRAAEVIYAYRDDVNDATRDFAASLAAFADQSGVGVYPGPGRYAALADALQRDPQDGDPIAMPEYSRAP